VLLDETITMVDGIVVVDCCIVIETSTTTIVDGIVLDVCY
jgi:hypothetical protein